MELIDGKRFDAQEAELHSGKLQALHAGRSSGPRLCPIHVLVTLSTVKEPPDSVESRSILLERERSHRHGL